MFICVICPVIFDIVKVFIILIVMYDSCYSVVELREDVEYQVQFNAGERRMAIMVSLSPEFPLEKPVLRVSPPINHPWCNEHSEITSAPGLLNVRSFISIIHSIKNHKDHLVLHDSLQCIVILVVLFKLSLESSAKIHRSY